MFKHKIKNVGGLAALYTGVLENHNRIHAADDALETKIAAFLAASLVIITLAIDSFTKWNVVTFCGVALILLSTAISIYILWSRNYSSSAVKVVDNTDYLDMDDRELLLQLIADCENSIEKSKKILERKNKVYPFALIMFIAGSAATVISLVV